MLNIAGRQAFLIFSLCFLQTTCFLNLSQSSHPGCKLSQDDLVGELMAVTKEDAGHRHPN